MARERPSDESDDSDRNSQFWTIPTVLRFTAFVLLVVGFIGILETGSDPIDLGSRYSLAFVGGILSAVVSIYLAIYRHGTERP